MEQIPSEYTDLFERKTIAHFATLNCDGSPHVTPVWIDMDSDSGRLLVNTERHRRKTNNAGQREWVAASMTDPEDPYRYLSITGRVVSIPTENARKHIDQLARRYQDVDTYQNEIESERVILEITPTEVIAHG